MPRRLLPLLLALCSNLSVVGAGQPLTVSLTASTSAARSAATAARTPVRGTAGILAATSAVGSAPTPTAKSAAPTLAANGRFSMNLYRAGDFVTQYTKTWCVAAAVQIMLNMTRRRDDVTRHTQARVFQLALALSQNLRYRRTSEKGWAATLTRLGAGRYEVRTERTRERAIHVAADAIRRTGRPVGLLTWRGAHSWVMHGFSATSDPLIGAFKVTGAYASDPWYPKVSTIWGVLCRRTRS